MTSRLRRVLLSLVISLEAAHAAAQTANLSALNLTITVTPNQTWSIGQVQLPLTATGATGGYLWSVSGTLPPGVLLRTDVPPGSPAGTTAGLIGLATTPGTYRLTLSVASGGQMAAQDVIIKVTGLTLKLDTPMPDAFVGVPYSYTLTPLNNAGGNFAVLNPNTQCGLTLSESGIISGTPTTVGACGFQVSYTDGVDTLSGGVTVNVYKVHFTGGGVLPNAGLGEPYSFTLTAGGGTPPYTFTAGGVPSGLSLSPSGSLTGTAAGGAGPQIVHVTVTDSAGLSYTETMMLDVIGTPPALPGLWIDQGSGYLEDCSYGVPCGNRNIGTVNGGTAPFAYTVKGLPPGMDYRVANGNGNGANVAGDLQLWGTPVALGTFNVDVTVTDANHVTARQIFPLTISPLMVDPDPLPPGTRGIPYSTALRVLGGTGSYSVRLAPNLPGGNGVLPYGLALSGMVISGTPEENGSFFYPDFIFSDGSHTLQVGEYPEIGGGASTIVIEQNSDLGTVTQGAAYSFQLSACCASGYSWASLGGNWPPGIGISPAGLLRGAPTTPGTYDFLVQAADSGSPSNYGSRHLHLVVTPLEFISGMLPDGVTGAFYRQALFATGGAGPYEWTVVPGTYPPPGLALDARSGVLSGWPTGGSFSFSVSVADRENHTFVRQFGLSIYGGAAAPVPRRRSSPAGAP